MWQNKLSKALPFLSFPLLGGYGYWGFHKHLFGIHKEVEKLEYSKEKIPFDESTQRIIDELTRFLIMRWNPVQVAGIKFFWSNTLDPVSRGSKQTSQGILLGIPYNFSYRNVADIDTSKLNLDISHPVDRSSEDEQKLLNSLVLSDNSKKFAIARELHLLESFSLAISSVAGIVFAFGALFTVYTINRSPFFHYKKTKQVFRIGMYITIAGLYTYLHQGLLKFYYTRLHRRADEKTASMGEDFAAGGVDYYLQLLKRNQVLRTLGGSSGEGKYTPWGDEIPGLFSFNVPLTFRLKCLIAESKKLYPEETTGVESDNSEAL